MTTATIFENQARTKISTATIATENTMPTGNKSVEMSLSTKALAPLMGVLTRLYSKPGLATLREVSSNAIDAQKALRAKMEEAGVENLDDPEAQWNRPIEITMPSNWDTTLTIRDFGVGMDEHVLLYVYPKYGESLKVDDMEQIGAFGLGAKSPLGLTQQYSVISVSGGIKREALVFLNERSIGQVEIMSEEPTDEPTGTTISIPIANVSDFLNETRDFFYSWKPGTVKVDGQFPKSFYDSEIIATDEEGFYFTLPNRTDRYSSARGEMIVVMGGLDYRVDMQAAGLRDSYGYNNIKTVADYYRYQGIPTNVLIDVPIGYLELTPAREDLAYSARTKKNLKALFDKIVEQVPVAVVNSIAKAENRKSALDNYMSWGNAIDVLARYDAIKTDTLMWNDEKIETTLVSPKNQRITYGNGRAHRSKGGEGTIPLSQNFYGQSKKVYYSVLSENKMHSGMAKIRHYLNSKDANLDNSVFYMLTEKPKSKWLTENATFTFVPWTEVEEGARTWMKIQREEAKKNPKETQKVKAVTYDGYSIDKDDKVTPVEISTGDLTEDILYYHDAGDYYYQRNHRQALIVAKRYGLGTKMVVIPRTRKVEAFQKRLPDGVKGVSVKDAIRKGVQDDLNSLTGAQRESITNSHYYSNRRSVLAFISNLVVENKAEIKDTEMVTLAEAYTGKDTIDKKILDRINLGVSALNTSARYLLEDTEGSEQSTVKKFENYVLKNAPLALSTDIGSVDKNHVIAYLNMAFVAQV